MKRFSLKLVVHSFFILALTSAIIVGRYSSDVHQSTLDFGSLPTNFVSNSVCFNSKLEHAKASNRLIHAETIILGSSMALNNVAVPELSKKFKEPVYNMSSWALKPYESYEILKQLDNEITVRHLIIPFNHTEFGKDSKTIDYDGVRTFFTSENAWHKVQNYMANFTVDGLIKDWSMRTRYSHTGNANLSLNFDEAGAIMQHPQQYIFDKSSRRLAYRDTTGFHDFTVSIDSINRFCRKRNIKLTLVYLPWRRDVLTQKNQQQVSYVGNYLSARYHENFINLSNLSVSNDNYVDAGHMFERGAQVVTQALVDSLSLKRVGSGPDRIGIEQSRTLVSR